MCNQPTPQIVREFCIIKIGTNDKKAKKLIQDCENRAKKLATKIGIKKFHITKINTLDMINAFTDYPMYLLGPDAPKIKTYKDVWAHGFNCKHQIIIRDKDWIEQDYKEWKKKNKQ